MIARNLAATAARLTRRSAIPSHVAAAAAATAPSALFSSLAARSDDAPSSLRLAPLNRACSLLPSTLTHTRAAASATITPQRRAFASITLTPTTASYYDSRMSSFLDCLSTLLEAPRFEAANLDVTLADGVLSVASPTRGTWVLNKHGPTRQIWLSSPVSGPNKFNLHEEQEEAGAKANRGACGEGWLGERDASDSLKARIITEWNEAFGGRIDPVDDFQSAHE